MAPDVASAVAQLGRREHWTGEDDLVFVGETGGYLHRSPLRRRYKLALDQAGLRRLRFHDLRHTFETRIIAKADIRQGAGVDGSRRCPDDDALPAPCATQRGRRPGRGRVPG